MEAYFEVKRYINLRTADIDTFLWYTNLSIPLLCNFRQIFKEKRPLTDINNEGSFMQSYLNNNHDNIF